MHYYLLMTLSSNLVLLNMPKISWIYAPCAQGKSTQKPYLGQYAIPDRPGHTISADTWHATEEDNNGNKYYAVFLDHYSLKSWIFLFASKSSLESITISFFKNMYNDIGQHPAIFHPDGEGGFVSTKVRQYLQSVGTTLQTSLPECHQQNGLVENYHKHGAQQITRIGTYFGA